MIAYIGTGALLAVLAFGCVFAAPLYFRRGQGRSIPGREKAREQFPDRT